MNATGYMIGALVIGLACAPVQARMANRGRSVESGVPFMDVKRSCSDADKFSISGDDKTSAMKGCMQDELAAKKTLARGWSGYKRSDRQLCVEEGGEPSPSYVEVLTCIEMSTNKMMSSSDATNPEAKGGLPLTTSHLRNRGIAHRQLHAPR